MKFKGFKQGLIIFIGIVFLIFTIGFFIFDSFNIKSNESKRISYENFINNHKFSTRQNFKGKDKKEVPKADRPDLAYEQNFLMTMDPALGYPPVNRLFSVYERVRQNKKLKSGIPGDALNNWVERGPDNIAGRVRAIMFDPNDGTNKKVWAGSVSGGLWYNNDITDVNSIWHAVDDFWSNIAISAIACDPTNTQVFYVGTGEGWYNSNAVEGAGIWKTIDGGLNWNQLDSTNVNNFNSVQKIVVSQTGRIIAATNNGIFISDDGGTSWNVKTPGFASDLEIASDGVIWAGKGRTGTIGGLYKSINNGDSWTKIVLTGTDPERVELAVAPSNSLVVYAIASSGGKVAWLKKSKDGGVTWINKTIPKYIEQSCIQSTTDDFTRGQAWFNLILAVHPINSDTLFAGGIDLNKSINGGTTWSTISSWTGSCNPYVHADQHAIVFRPGFPNELVGGSDGGITYSGNAGISAKPEFSDRNKGLNITQYYSCAIHPDPLKNYFLGGSQDNGSHKFVSEGVNSVNFITGGDGGFCFIDQKNPEIQISSYINNNYYVSKNGGLTFNTLLSGDDGSFINPSDYDDNLHILYSAKSSTSINRITSINTTAVVGSLTITGLGSKASHIRVSPYTSTSSTIFVGTEAGRLFKVINAEGSSSISTQITGSAFPTGYISCIDLGADENELLVTFSNYGISSVWYTNDGGANWFEKEGNLPDMPVRWALFNPNNRNQAIIATEVGIWATSNLNVSSPLWNPSVSGLSNVRVDMLQIRESDNEIVAATHGRGFFTSDAFSNLDKNALNAYFSAKGSTNLKFGGTIEFEDMSTGSPTSRSWTFSGGDPATSNSANPIVNYPLSGIYEVSLTVSNGIESKTLTKSEYVKIGGSNQWVQQASGFTSQSRGIDYIDVVDKNTIWATSFDGSNFDNKIKEFTKTIDGGKHWNPGIIDIPGEIYPAMVCALNKDTAYIPMYPNVPGAGGGIYITTDGGQSWTKQSTATFTGNDAFANVVYFWNKNDGFCMGDPNQGYFEIYTTNNGGLNWVRVLQSKIPASSGTDEYGTVGQFCVGDDDVVFFNTTKGRIFKSKDKGASWSLITTPLTGRTKIAFADENHGVLIENNENVSTFKVYYTLNGGATWTLTSRQNVYSSNIEYVAGTGRMYVSSSANASKAGASYSVDGGINWIKFNDLNETQCLALDFYDMTLGWIGEFNSSSVQGGMLKYYGLSTIADFTINPSSPEVDVPASFTDNSLSKEPSNTYIWNFGENSNPQTVDTKGPHNVTYSVKGTKTVTLTINGVSVSKQFNIIATGVEDIIKIPNINVYPNPSQGKFNIQFGQTSKNDMDISIFNIKGQRIYYNKLKYLNSGSNLSIDISKLGKGIFILKIKGINVDETHKIIVR